MSTTPPPISSSDTEALFCVALLNTLNTRQTADVLARFLELRENPSPALVALGRTPPPDAFSAPADDLPMRLRPPFVSPTYPKF